MTDEQLAVYALAQLINELPDPRGEMGELFRALSRSATNNVLSTEAILAVVVGDMDELSDSKRLELIHKMLGHFCVHCGSDLRPTQADILHGDNRNRQCHCTNDE